MRTKHPEKIIIPPAQPILAAGHVQHALSSLRDAKRFYEVSQIHNTPLWSALTRAEYSLRIALERLEGSLL